MQGSRLGLIQYRIELLVQDIFLKCHHAEAEVTDDTLKAVVVRLLLECECPHLLEIELDTFNPGVDILSKDEVFLGFDKVFVVQLLLFEPINFVVAHQTEDTVSQAL